MMRDHPSAGTSSGNDPSESGWMLAFIPTTSQSPQGTTYGQITDVVYQPARPSSPRPTTCSPPAPAQPPLKSYQPYDMTGSNPYRPAPVRQHRVHEAYTPPPTQRPGLKSYQPFNMTGSDTYHPPPARPHQVVRLPSYTERQRLEDVYEADRQARSPPAASSSQYITLSSPQPSSPPAAPSPSYPPSDLRGKADWKEYYDDKLGDRHPCAQSRSFKILEAALEVQGSGAPGLPDPRIATAEQKRRERRRAPPPEAVTYTPQEPSYHSQETPAYQPHDVHVAPAHHPQEAPVHAPAEPPVHEPAHDPTIHAPVQSQVQEPAHPPVHDEPAAVHAPPEAAPAGTHQEAPVDVPKEASTAVAHETPVEVPPETVVHPVDPVNPQQQQQHVPTDF